MLDFLRSWFGKRPSGSKTRHEIGCRKPSPYLKQTLLFMLAVVLPSSALVLLSLRMIVQEKELAEKRSAERRAEVGRQFGATLLKALGELAEGAVELQRRELRAAEWKLLDGDVALVAMVASDGLVLPWDRKPETELFSEMLRQPPFGNSLSAGQRFEFSEGELRLAVASYREAAQVAGLPAQQTYARLALARVLCKMGATQEADEQLQWVLKAPLTTRDEFDVPLALYAAGQFISEGRQAQLVFSTVADAVNSPTGLSPAATYMARDYLEQLRSPDRKETIENLLRQIQARMKLHTQCEDLKRNFPLIRAALTRSRDGTPFTQRWTLHGAEPWLVSMVQMRPSEETALLAVKVGNVSRRVLQGAGFEMLQDVPQIIRGPHAQGVWLGEAFPDLQVILPTSGQVLWQSEPQLRLYSTLIVLVVGITLFGAYLWWRDTRRELKLAELRSDFVSSVSHELKTPLTSVRMLAETLRIRDVGVRERNEYLDLILSESERLGRLLKNVLDFSTIEKGTRAYQMELVELGPLIEAAVRCIQQPLREKNLELQIVDSAAKVILKADRDALEQAILNLLHNAIKYSSKDNRIELHTHHDGREVVIQVRDFGVGIQPRDHQRIFERFYRAPEDHNRRIAGTGLGLSLVKHIVQSHGGRVTVESALGHGSTFRIYLPTEHTEHTER